MIKIFKITVFITAIGLLSYSCDLDLTPSYSIAREDAFNTVDDAVNFENGVAHYFRSCQYHVFAFTSELQTDMFNASIDHGNRNGAVHRNDANFTADEYNTRDVWRQIYKTIMSANNLLENIGNVVLDIDPAKAAIEQAQLDVLKGRVYFYRAASYHYLVKHYANDYEPSSAATDLGVPLVLTYDIAEKPARATVAVVYTQILEDIAQAKILLSGVQGEVRSIVPTIDAVTALEARVQLCMHNYPDAATLAGSLIDGGKYTLANTAELMTDEWVNDAGPEDIFQMFASLSEYGTTPTGSGSGNTRMANNVYLMYNTTLNRYAPDYIPTQTCVDRYETSDLRRNEWFPVLPVTLASQQVDLNLFNKFSGNPELYTPPTRNYSHKPKIFRIAEMYLIRAEASLAAGKDADALTALKALQSARGATLTTATEGNIQIEWAKEMIGEGMRLECLKRWKLGYSRGIAQNLDVISVGLNFNEKIATATDFRFLWPIPASEISVNRNLVQNSQW